MSDLVSVLIIEDEEAVFGLIKETLTKSKPPGWPLKYKVHNAPTLASAVRMTASIKWSIIILDIGLPDSQGIDTFWKVHERVGDKTPIIVLTGRESNGLFEEILADGAYRCFSKLDIAPCMRILHYSIRHVLYEHAQKELIDRQSETIAGKLKPTIRSCAGCERWYDEQLGRWVSRKMYFKQRNVIESHGHCPDCRRDFYDKDLREATKEFE